jgi:hypothetical protein
MTSHIYISNNFEESHYLFMSDTVYRTQFLLFSGEKVKIKLRVNEFSCLEDVSSVNQIVHTTPQLYTYDAPHIYC